jgi:hypothetical protein
MQNDAKESIGKVLLGIGKSVIIMPSFFLNNSLMQNDAK